MKEREKGFLILVFICYSVFSSATVPAFGFFHLRFFHLIATVFSAINFQFQQNKFYPNRPSV